MRQACLPAASRTVFCPHYISPAALIGDSTGTKAAPMLSSGGGGHQYGPKETGMTTQENKQLAINGYQMFLKGDIQGVLDMCTEDVEWTSADLPSVPFAGAFHGRSGVTDFFQKLGDAVEFLDYQPQTFIADDDKVA